MANEMNEDDGATVRTQNEHIEGFEPESETSKLSSLVLVDEFLDTPSLGDVRKQLDRTKYSTLSNMISSHPANMKDIILHHARKMFDLRERNAQKIKSQYKLNSKTEEEKSYIPGSLRKKAPLSGPNCLKGNERIDNM